MTYAVWRTTYAYYWEVERDGDIPPLLIRHGMPLQAAIDLANELGFGHCAKPEGAT